MSCASASLVVPLPGLPGGVSVGATPPPFSPVVGLCCQFQPFTIVPDSVSLGLVVPGPIAATLAGLEAAIRAYTDALALNVACPAD